MWMQSESTHKVGVNILKSGFAQLPVALAYQQCASLWLSLSFEQIPLLTLTVRSYFTASLVQSLAAD